MTGYVCSGASASVLTGEMFVISDLVAGPAYWFECAARAAAGFSPFSTASQMVTAKAPPLPPVFLGFSPRIQTVVVEVSTVCGATIQQSANISQCVPWTFVGGLQQAKNARSARCNKCLSAGVYEFSSPAVKPGHGFMISSLTLEFEYLVGGPRTETSVWGFLISTTSWYTAEFWSKTSAVLRVVGTTSTSVSARSTPQELPLGLRVALRSTFTYRAASQSC